MNVNMLPNIYVGLILAIQKTTAKVEAFSKGHCEAKEVAPD